LGPGFLLAREWQPDNWKKADGSAVDESIFKEKNYRR